jgi:hypothetical protein
MLPTAECWQSGPLRMTPMEAILMEKVSQTPHDWATSHFCGVCEALSAFFNLFA